MSTTQGARRIFWMVRLLGALGLVIVVVIICQVSFQLSSIRNSRTRLHSEEDLQNQTSRNILDHALSAQKEIQATLETMSREEQLAFWQAQTEKLRERRHRAQNHRPESVPAA